MFDDLRYAWRRLRSAPAFAMTAVITLALGIGANTAIFSVADAVLFRPLPYSDPQAALLQMRDAATGVRYVLVAYPTSAIDQHHSGLSEVGLVGRGERSSTPMRSDRPMCRSRASRQTISICSARARRAAGS